MRATGMKKAAGFAGEAAFSNHQTGAFDMQKNRELNNKSQWLVLHRGQRIPFAELVALFGQRKAGVFHG